MFPGTYPTDEMEFTMFPAACPTDEMEIYNVSERSTVGYPPGNIVNFIFTLRQVLRNIVSGEKLCFSNSFERKYRISLSLKIKTYFYDRRKHLYNIK